MENQKVKEADITKRVFSPKKYFKENFRVSTEQYNEFVDSLDEAHKCFNKKTKELSRFHREALIGSEIELSNLIIN